MSWLVTGASGFIGWHLVDRLSRAGIAVTAWCRGTQPLWSSAEVSIKVVDIQDPEAVAREMNATAPRVIIHLAAQSLPIKSWADPVSAMRTNVEGTIHMLEAMRALPAPGPRLLFAGTSGLYASSRDGSPIAEDALAEPGSPYAVSKLAAEAYARLYVRAYQLDVVRFRPFFWIGPRKTGDVASDLARRIVEIEHGGRPVLRVGRTDVVRDIIDVQDGISALLLLAERGQSGEVYNVCRGKGTSIGDLITAYRVLAHVQFQVAVDAELMRPVDEPIRVGNPTRLKSLGWAPEIPIERSLERILDYWRRQENERER